MCIIVTKGFQSVLKTIPETRSLMAGLNDVERVLAGAMIEHGIYGRANHLVIREEFFAITLISFQGANPDAHIGVIAQRPVGHFQGDTEDILINEKVAACEMETVKEAYQIEEERITAGSG
jgi:hypothetical protein